DNSFNGFSPYCYLQLTAYLWQIESNGNLDRQRVSIEPGSLASQSVGPPLSKFEMSCDGRVFPKLGRKLLSLRPLAKQFVDPTDSVLGALASGSGTPGSRGLTTSYPV